MPLIPSSLGRPSSSLGMVPGGLGAVGTPGQPLSRSDIAFGFETGRIEHRRMNGDFVQTLNTLSGDVRGLCFDRSGNLYAVLSSGQIQKFRQSDATSLGRWDTGLTWDATHIPWDICCAVDGTLWVLWADDQASGTQHGIYQVNAAGTTILQTWRLTASTGYYGGGGEARQLKLDLANAWTMPSDGIQHTFWYSDGYYALYQHDMNSSSGVVKFTYVSTAPWQVAGFRARPDASSDTFLVAETKVGVNVPAGPRNAVCINADGSTLWADEVNVANDIEAPGVQHADRYQIVSPNPPPASQHVRRITTGIQQTILAMASWTASDGPFPAVCGDIFAGVINPVSGNAEVWIVDGATRAVKGVLEAGFLSWGYSACADSVDNVYFAVDTDSDSLPTRYSSVVKWAKSGGAYQNHTRFWATLTAWPTGRVRNVSIDADDNLYIGWIDSAIHVTKVLPDGTDVYTRDLPGATGSLRGGTVTTDGARFFYVMNASGQLVIKAYDLDADAPLADFLNEASSAEDFLFFPYSLRYSNGLLVVNNEGGPADPPGDDGIARQYASRSTAGPFHAFPHAPTLVLNEDVENPEDLALDYVSNCIVVASEFSPQNDRDNLLLSRVNVETRTTIELLRRLADNFSSTTPVAVLCPGLLIPVPIPRSAERVQVVWNG